MTQAFQIGQIVKDIIRKKGESNRKYYNRKARSVNIEMGDRVMLRNHKEKGGTGNLHNY